MTNTRTRPSTLCKGCWNQMKAPIPIGGVVNLAARLESAATAGETVVSREVASRLGADENGDDLGREHRSLTLKGFTEPVQVIVLSAEGNA